MARVSVSSSACSRPPPAGRPCARRVTVTGSSRSRVGEIVGGRLAFHVGAEGEDDFGRGFGFDALEEGVDAQILGADVIERGDAAAERVVAAAETRRCVRAAESPWAARRRRSARGRAWDRRRFRRASRWRRSRSAGRRGWSRGRRRMTRAISSGRASRDWSIQRAMRSALRGPMPGRRLSSAMSALIAAG